MHTMPRMTYSTLMQNHEIAPGSTHPFGAVVEAEGTNFSIFSQDATEMMLLLFDSPDAVEPYQAIRFDPFRDKTFHFWHIFVKGLKAGAYYAFRVDGPNNPATGFRFNANKVLIGPYARASQKSYGNGRTPARLLTIRRRRCGARYSTQRNTTGKGDQPLKIPIHESIIYETHVGG